MSSRALAAILIGLLSIGASGPQAGFDVVALGVQGGGDGGDLASYLIHPAGDPRGVTCDAGTLVAGLQKARAAGAFGRPAADVRDLLRTRVRGYLISHAHLDHVAGLLIAAPDDGAKTVYALPSVNAAISRDYLNWRAWPNFADRGAKPIGQYKLQDLATGVATPLAGTAMTVTAFPLAHDGVESTAFLLRAGGTSLLCLGDTGPDPVEKAGALATLWQAVAAEVRQDRLRGIIIEASYPDDRADDRLFGHLTPRWLARSLEDLEQAAGAGSLSGLPVIVNHIKYPADRPDRLRATITRQLGAGNRIGVRFVIPRQGQYWRL
jgi:3',5'-cyclic-nucleotide phosphodiesterase